MALIDDILAAALPGPLKSAFGDSATYTPAAGSPVSITVVLSDVKPLETSVPGHITECDVFLADLASEPIRGDNITIGAIQYSVIEVVSDTAVGIATLTLRKK